MIMKTRRETYNLMLSPSNPSSSKIAFASGNTGVPVVFVSYAFVFTPFRLWHPRRRGPDGGIEGHQVGMEMPPFRHVQQGQGALPRTALFAGTDATGKGNDLIFFLQL